MDNVPGGTLQLTHPDGISRGTRANRANVDIIDLTNLQWSELVAEFDHRCVFCGKYCRNPTQDHLLPLSRGGNHTKTNVVPACGACNSRKNGMTLEEFASVADKTKFHPRLLETRLNGSFDSL